MLLEGIESGYSNPPKWGIVDCAISDKAVSNGCSPSMTREGQNTHSRSPIHDKRSGAPGILGPASAPTRRVDDQHDVQKWTMRVGSLVQTLQVPLLPT